MATKKEKEEFARWLFKFSFQNFLTIFGMFYDAAERRYVKWVPWPMQKDLCDLFDEFEIIWVMKARQLGISEMMALYAVFTALREPKSEICIISKKLPDAKYFLRKRVLTKLEAFYNLELSPGKKMNWWNYEKFEGKIEFENGSWIEAFSSDNEEVRSHTPRLILFDEIRSFTRADAKELWSAIVPSIREQPRGQAICVSTPRHGTWFNEMTKKIISEEVRGIQYFFMPGNAKPERTPEWYTRELRREPDHKIFYREYPRNEEDCFASREGAVWPQFDPKVGGRHVNRFNINFRWKYFLVYDHGYQHASAVMFALYDRYSDHLYIFDEVFIKQSEITETAYLIREKMNFYRRNLAAPKPQVAIADTACFAKTGQRPIADILRVVLGLNFKKSIKHDQKGSIALVSVRLSNGGLTIDPRCENTIRQINDWIWKNDPDEKKQEVPVDIEDDLCDTLLYLSADLLATPRVNPKAQKDIHFNPKFNAHKRQLVAKLRGYDNDEFGSVAEFSRDQLSAWEGL